MISSRRSFITGLVSFIAAPAIVRAASLMPVKLMTPIGASVMPFPPPPIELLDMMEQMRRFRDVLMPGLLDLRIRYETIPAQWEQDFGKCQ